ncbi:hypothetical protein ABZZ17_37310 [Streptomyces sp. NPDC006512]|uniref:hypothetical protein n=1 Tax=Streptomyces sp. NPDC006512 TaxID=3154307 RepID=UPI0033A08344
MRTTMPVTTTSVTTAALACAALLTLTACGPSSDAARAKPSPTATASAPAAPDPFAGKDPAAVLRTAYEETTRVRTKELDISLTKDGRQVQALLTVEDEKVCRGKVTVMRAGAADLYVEDDTLSFKGDEGFLKERFKDAARPGADPEGWISSEVSDPSVADLLDLCGQALPAAFFPGDRKDVRRVADTSYDQWRVAVFKSTMPGGGEVTDHVLMDGTPYLVKRQVGGPDFAGTEYLKLPGLDRKPSPSPSGSARPS